MVTQESIPNADQQPCIVTVSRPQTTGGMDARYAVKSVSAGLVALLTRIRRADEDGEHVHVTLAERGGRIICQMQTQERGYGEAAPEFPGELPV